MLKGSKEALTVLIVTHVEGVERSLNSFHFLLMLLMSKGSKEALTILIVTHVEGVERSLTSFNCYSCRRGRKKPYQF